MAKTAARQKAARPGISTSPQREPVAKLRRNRTVRQVVVGLMVVFVALGVAGVFGSKTGGVTASANGYDLTVIYPKVTRPGLPVRWIYTVHHAGGFDGQIDIATTFEYLNLFDLTGIDPDASSQTATGGQIVWSFDPPEGDVFSVAFDAATEVGIHEIGPATGSVVVNGKPVVQVHFKTVVMP